MASKTDATETPMAQEVETFIDKVADYYGLAIVARGNYFDSDTHAADSKALRYAQNVIGKMVAAHDTLADATGNVRLVGKRGRKSGSTSKPTTAAEVLKALGV